VRIGVDCQALQTIDSATRGRGVYTRSVLGQLLAQGTDSYELFFNSSLQAATPVEGQAGSHAIEYQSPLPSPQTSVLNQLLQQLEYERYDLDLLHITSPLEGSDAVILSANRNYPFPVAATLFDLIPLVFEDVYLKAPSIRQLYVQRVQWYRHAEVVLSISEHSRLDAIRLLGLSPKRIVTVGASADPLFRKLDRQTAEPLYQSVKQELGIRSGFVLYTGGFDFRKNLEGALRAFSLLPEHTRRKYQLVIVCSLSDDQRRLLQQLAERYGIAGSLVLTGYIPQQSLLLLFNYCDVFIYPSLYEGFGLPVLEAMSCGAAVVANATSSIPEVLGDAGLQVDPSDIPSFARAVEDVLTSKGLQQELRGRSLERAGRFSWEATAQATRAAYEASRSWRYRSTFVLEGRKPKIAFFSPLPPQSSGIADYSAELLPHLAKYFEIDAFVDDSIAIDVTALEGVRLRSGYRGFNARDYYSAIFQMGNNPVHSDVYDLLLNHPGIPVLHEVHLHDLVYWIFMNLRRNPERYEEELIYEGGEEARVALHMLRRGELTREQLTQIFPMNQRVLCASKATIVHSACARRQLISGRTAQAAARVGHINQGVSLPELPSGSAKTALRRALEIPEAAFVVAIAGFMTPSKLLEQCLGAFRLLLARQPNANCVAIGSFFSPDYESAIGALCTQLGIADRVRFTGHVPLGQFYSYLFACDAVLNLRHPSRGETSATMLRALSCGLPTVVSDVGSFSELPNETVIKVAAGKIPAEELHAALLPLMEDESLRQRIGRAARRYVAERHSWPKIAEQYAHFIHFIEDNGLGDQTILREALSSMIRNGSASDPALPQELAKVMSALASSEAIGTLLWV
jgi:glycosyltransferase involved in cell wall biosynthesis